jgi:hypothetical protein
MSAQPLVLYLPQAAELLNMPEARTSAPRRLLA